MNILNLRDWDVHDVTETEGGYQVRATYRPQPTACTGCGTVGELYRHGTTAQVIHDVPTLGRPMAIHATRTRFKCRACGTVFRQPLPDLDDKGTMTKRLDQYVREQGLKRTFISVADDVGVTEGTVRNVVGKYIEHLDKTVRFQTPEWLGIDELHLIGKPRCILTNVKEKTAVDLLINRDQNTLSRYLTNLSDRNKIRLVTMDMWRPYKTSVQALMPQATIIVDKFHVVRMAGNAMERARKDIRSGLNAKQRRTLMHDRHILLKRGTRLSEQERIVLDLWVHAFPLLGEAYRLKEEFYDIWDTDSRSEAQRRYQAWEQSIPSALRPAFADLTKAVTNWGDEIFAYFDHPITNAYTEALNGLIKITSRMGRGYSFPVIRAKLLYSRGVQKRDIVREPGTLYMPEENMAAMFKVEAFANNSFGASLSTLTERLETGEI